MIRRRLGLLAASCAVAGLLTAFPAGATLVQIDPSQNNIVCASGCASPSAFVQKGATTLAASTSTNRVALPTTDATVVIYNPGTTNGHVKLGNAAVNAATTDLILPPGISVISNAAANADLAAIMESGSPTLQIWTGTGSAQFALAGSSASGGGDASAANQNTQITALGGVTETAPASDTASSGLNGRLQRIAQRLSSLITALGSPFQAGGSIGNSAFAATSTITSPTSTPTISTSAYSTGMVLGGIQSWTSQPTSGVISNAHVQFASGTFTGSVDLELFGASPTGGGTSDHAAYALTATDTAKKIGELHLNDCTSDGGVVVACQNLYQSQFYTLAAAGTTIFFVAVVRGAPTFAGTTDATFGGQVLK